MGKRVAGQKSNGVQDIKTNAVKILWISLAMLAVIIIIFLSIRFWPLGTTGQNNRQNDPSSQNISNETNEKKLLEAYNRGDYKAAIPNLRKLVALRKDDPSAHEMLATAYLLMGDNKQAFNELQVVLKAKPDDAEALYRVGVLLERMDRMSEAITYLNRATKTAPNVILFHSELARANAKAKYYPNAIDEWKAVLNLLPPADKTRATVIAELANIYILQNDYAQAKGIIATGLSLDPSNEALRALDAKIGGQIQGSPAPPGR